MAESLIPYSFVPGTKAMASEVNANFIALAQTVEEGKSYTESAISDFNNQLETKLDEFGGVVDGKMEPNLANCTSVTNCLISVPQRHNVVLSGNSVILKAGSKKIVPNGFQEDGVTPRFDYIDLDVDMTWGATTATNQRLCFLSAGNTVSNYSTSWAVVSSSVPTVTTTYCYWWDTTNNLIKVTANNGASWSSGYSLPIFLATGNGSGFSSLDVVFNGAGFIAGTYWLDKDVTGIIPQGRNADGSMKNAVCTTTRLKHATIAQTASDAKAYLTPSGGLDFSGIASYDVRRNLNVKTNGEILTAVPFCSFSLVPGSISNFKPYSPLTLATSIDLERKANIDMSNVVIDYASPVTISSGWTATKSGVVYYNMMTDTSRERASITISGKTIALNAQTGSNRNHQEIGGLVFVSKGQVVTAVGGEFYELTFYPFK